MPTISVGQMIAQTDAAISAGEKAVSALGEAINGDGANLVNRVNGNFGGYKRYNGVWNSCVDYAWDALDVADVSHRGSTGAPFLHE